MDFHTVISNPATQQALIALASWAIAQGVKKLGANPRYAPYVAIVSGVVASVSTGAATGDGSFPMNAALGLLSGLIASGGHEAIKKAAGK